MGFKEHEKGIYTKQKDDPITVYLRNNVER